MKGKTRKTRARIIRSLYLDRVYEGKGGGEAAGEKKNERNRGSTFIREGLQGELLLLSFFFDEKSRITPLNQPTKWNIN